ncbi:ribosome biogenesis GTP-binding protein YihA/YsxC [Corticicoccus populi]|uniref:Probable GTP-binding protein EngB n=1 Tax=Corticicoccus populi TaxID=1812821 RepID=A0ABW5WT72_9STAP
MKINPNKVEFMISAVSDAQYPDTPLKEIALSGRSNVGKSSFINSVSGRKNIARISSKPGKTVTLNFYNMDEKFLFVDVPGYGYAKQSKKEREKWGKMIEAYLTDRKELSCVVQLIDIRHKPSEDDILMYDYLKHFEIPVIVVCTKSDKISKNKMPQHLKVIREDLELEETDQLIPFSSVDKKNLPQVMSAMSEFI